MTCGAAGRPGEAVPWAGRASGWLRASRGGLFAVALAVGAGSGLGAVAFRYLIYFFTWLATGHVQFGQQGRVPSNHLPWLGLAFFVVIPVIGGLIYGPLIYRYAREARGHGVPEVMIAVAEGGGRIRPQVAAVKSLASALCIGTGGSVGREGPIVQIGSALASSLGQWVKMPALYAVVAMGAVFASAARAPLTAVASVVEMTGDYTLTLPVMLAVAIATALSRALSYGTIYTTKLLRRGTDKHHPQMLFASESLTQALRQLELYGRDGLPVISADRQQLQGWITSQNVLQAVARQMHAAPADPPASRAAALAVPGPQAAPGQPPDPLRGYQILEITISAGSPANGKTLGDTSWPPGWIPVTILDNHTLRDPDPGITLAPGDRINLLAREPHNPQPEHSYDQPASQPDGHPPDPRPATPTA